MLVRRTSPALVLVLAVAGCARSEVRGLELGGEGAADANSIASDATFGDAGPLDLGTGDTGGAVDASADAGRDGGLDSGFDSGTNARLVSLTLDPPSLSLIVGATADLTATGIYDDGTHADVTAVAAWAVDDQRVASVRQGELSALGPGRAKVTATLAGITGAAELEVTAHVVTAIVVTPAEVSVPAGVQVAFTADGILDDSTHVDLTASATWRSSDPRVASAAPGGVVTTRAAGGARIVADFQNVEGTASLTVTPATLVSLEVEPLDPTVGAGTTLTFTAVGVYSDNTSADVTALVAWSSSDSTVLSVDPSGAARALRAGTSVVTATLDGLGARSTVNVSPAALVSITVSPEESVIAAGTTVALTARGQYADGTTRDLTASATWASSDPAVASISNASGTIGTVTGLAPGVVGITATFGGVAGRARVTVSPATLRQLMIVPDRATLAVGTTLQLRATATYSDGSTRDVTGSATWSSAFPSIATVQNGPNGGGLVSALSFGRTIITAQLGGFVANMSLEVTMSVLLAITVTPADTTLRVGATMGYTATAQYADGTLADVTSQATWSTGDPSVATISNATGTRGSLLARAAGRTTVTAEFDGVVGTTSVVVVGSTLLAITVTPVDRSVPVRTLVQYTATASYTDGTTRNITGLATWSTSDPHVASVGAGGTATAVTPGVTTISATYQGATGSTTLTVESATPVRLEVDPVAPSIAVGGIIRFQAIVIYSDGTSQNAGPMVQWSSSDPNVLAFASGPGGGAAGRGVGPGTAVVTATYQGLTGSTTVTVTEATLVSLSITPPAGSVTVGVQRQLTATAIYSDGTSRNVTAQATWTSSDPMVIQVSNGRARGLAEALSPGQATITATYMGVSATATYQVTGATITSIQVTPFALSVAAGTIVQFQAVALFSDGTSMNVTPQATWTSSDPSVAAVSNGGPAGMGRGIATALAAGATEIHASYQGMDGWTVLTVTAATITQIQVTPFAPVIPAGYGVGMRATAVYSDATTRDVTLLSTWTSDNPAVAAVSSAGTTRGLVTTFAAGRATIRAQYRGFTGSTTLTVSAETLQSITIDPGMAVLHVGESTQLRATGLFSSGTRLDLTELVTWQSTDPSVADVSNAVASQGLATGLRPGAARVSATRGPIIGWSALTVQ